MEFVQQGLASLRIDEPAAAERRSSIRDEALRSRARTEGDVLVERIKRALNSFKIKASPKQAEFQRNCLASLLPYLYGNEWDRNSREILARHNLQDACPIAAFIAARSDGKTIAASMMLAALLYVCPERRMLIGLFAGYQSQTSAIVSRVYEFLLELEGGQSMAEKSDKVLRVWPQGASHRNTPPSVLMAKSSNADAARGMQPNIILVDEAHFVANPYYFNVILPMVMANKRVLWMITSPSARRGVFETLVTGKDRKGRPLAAVTKTETCGCGNVCSHRLVRALVHKTDPRKSDAMREVYASNPDARARELQGIADHELRNVFEEDTVEYALRHHVELVNPVPYVFVGVDPSGAGENSKTAWVIFTFQDENIVVRAPRLGSVVGRPVAARPLCGKPAPGVVDLVHVALAHLHHEVEGVVIVGARRLGRGHAGRHLLVEVDAHAVVQVEPERVEAHGHAALGHPYAHGVRENDER